MEQKPLGHFLAFITILIWGTTFTSTKILLLAFTPIEILFIRFVIGYIALLLLYPKRLKINDRRREWLFAAAGICGITLYYLLENIALTFTTASNVGIIVIIAPFFTALLAAMTWAVYSILAKKISELGFNTIQTTRRIFFYGLLFMLPMLFIMDFTLGLERFMVKDNLFNILFLSLGASAMCFVTWNTAVRLLGAVKTSVYIYLVPVVTVATAVIILKEPLTDILIAGALLTLAGLWLSETRVFERIKKSDK